MTDEIQTAKRCDQCGRKFTHTIHHALTEDGSWQFLCGPCFETDGIGLGNGLGYRYQRDTDGVTFYCVEGN